MFLEIITTLLSTIISIIGGFITAIFNNFGNILELIKIHEYLTPAGIIGLCTGVPTFIVSIILILIRKNMKKHS